MHETKETSSDKTISRKDASASVKAVCTFYCYWRKCSVVFDPE